MADNKLQWHPAFIAAMQIDFGEEASKLIFLTEHELNKMPMRMDALVVKKEGSEPLKKNIGRILRKYNIFEYKSPDESLTIDDFYKVYGYACFFKSNTEHTNAIPAQEITITYVCNHFPREMQKNLKRERGIELCCVAPGIYYFDGDPIPIQLLLTKDLSPEDNRWLSSLRPDLELDDHLDALLEDYEDHRDSKLYQAVMDLIVQANPVTMEEARDMCDALHQLFAEDIEKAKKETAIEITKEVTEKVTRQVTHKDILIFTETLLEDGYSEEALTQRLLDKFNLSLKEAQEYMKQARHLPCV